MKILICGGHLTPALAVINALPRESKILYVGRKYSLEGDKALSLEYQIIKKRGIPLAEIDTGKLQRVINIYSIGYILKLLKGFFQALYIINSFSPDVVVGFGSYVSIPLCIIGWIKKIPIIIHEQTSAAGLANKILARFATTVCISWESSKKYLHSKNIYLTGNPAVEDYFSVIKNIAEKKQPLRILILGGSQGSHTINLLIEHNLQRLLSLAAIAHQTGDAQKFKDYDRLQKYKKNLPKNLQNRYEIVKFFDPADLLREVANSDLVVTRGGANTILGLLVLNIPTLVIPLTISSQHDQWRNAQIIKNAGLGEIAYQNELDSNSFFALLSKMLDNRENYAISPSYKNQIEKHKNAAEKMAEIIIRQKTYRNQQKA